MDKPAPKRPQAKHWCFTINNYTNDELLPRQSEFDYMIVGYEVGKDGTPHLQGYVAMKKVQYLTAMKKLMPRAHLEVMKGTPQQASDYCKKDGQFKELGVLPQSQTKKALKKRQADYELAFELAKRQKLYEIDRGMLLRYGSSLRMIQKDHPAQMADNDYLCGIWMYGPPGVGKSRSARWMFPNSYPKPLNKWWDGYQHEDFVIIDDIEPVHSVLGHHIKQWADHYPFTAEQKGTSIRIRPKVLVITSNFTIDEIWSGTIAEAIRRRFVIVNCEQRNLRMQVPATQPFIYAEESMSEEL